MWLCFANDGATPLSFGDPWECCCDLLTSYLTTALGCFGYRSNVRLDQMLCNLNILRILMYYCQRLSLSEWTHRLNHYHLLYVLYLLRSHPFLCAFVNRSAQYFCSQKLPTDPSACSHIRLRVMDRFEPAEDPLHDCVLLFGNVR